jgi:hypothetical protein
MGASPLAKKEGASAAGAAPAAKGPFKWTLAHVGAVLLVVAALALPIYLAVVSPTVRAAGVGGFVGLFFGVLSAMVGLVRLVLTKRSPRALGLAALGASLGGAALLVAGLLAEAMRASAETLVAGDVAHEPGMREYLLAEASSGARTAALLGLVGIPGFIGGLLLLATVLGARRVAASDPKLKLDKPEPSSRAWLAIVGAVALFLGGVVADIRAIAEPVTHAEHPHAAKLVAIADAQKKGDMAAACDGLEAALVPDYAPPALLDDKLPGRLELAHRCVGFRIDGLPKEGCDAAAKTLAATETVKFAKAEERVAAACAGR